PAEPPLEVRGQRHHRQRPPFFRIQRRMVKSGFVARTHGARHLHRFDIEKLELALAVRGMRQEIEVRIHILKYREQLADSHWRFSPIRGRSPMAALAVASPRLRTMLTCSQTGILN